MPVQGEERGYGKRDSAVIGDSKQSVEKERTETGEVRTCCTWLQKPTRISTICAGGCRKREGWTRGTLHFWQKGHSNVIIDLMLKTEFLYSVCWLLKNLSLYYDVSYVKK